jgi:hypothetical protein
MKKFILAGMAVAMLAIPAVASADSTMTSNPNSTAGTLDQAVGTEAGLAAFDGSAMGFYNSRAKGQGAYISAQAHELGGRGAAVQVTLGH